MMDEEGIGEIKEDSDAVTTESQESCAWGSHPKHLFTVAEVALEASLACVQPVIPLDNSYPCLPDLPSTHIHISSLPSELLILILQLLRHDELCTNVASVCKAWYQLAYDPILWTKVSFRRKHVTSPSACRLLTYAPLLHTLDLHGQSLLALYVLPHVIQYSRYLRRLDLGFCDSVNSELLEILHRGSPQLVEINVEGCSRIDDSCIDVLVKFDKLRSLNLSHCTQLLDESITKLAEGVQWLEYLNIDGIAWVTLSGISSLSAHCHASLVSLDLDGAELADDAMDLVCRSTRLQRLSLSFAETLTDKCLPSLCNLKNLRHLRLRKGCTLTGEGLVRLLSSPVPCQTLQTLDLTECTMLSDDGVMALSKNCRVLRHLSLEWCWYITDRGLAAIVDNCSSLTHLDLLGIHAITGTSLARIPTDMPRLRYLDLQNCNEIDDDLVMDVIRRQPDMTVVNYYGEEFTSWRDKYSLSPTVCNVNTS